jgi:hypothetical protein
MKRAQVCSSTSRRFTTPNEFTKRWDLNPQINSKRNTKTHWQSKIKERESTSLGLPQYSILHERPSYDDIFRLDKLTDWL